MTEQQAATRRTAHGLLCFLDEMMQVIVRVEVSDPDVAPLSVLELSLLMAIAEASAPATVRELAEQSGMSLTQCEDVKEELKKKRLTERISDARGTDRGLSLTPRGRQLLQTLEADRQGALEDLIAQLAPADRLRVEGATHLLGHDLDRLSGGMLAT